MEPKSSHARSDSTARVSERLTDGAAACLRSRYCTGVPMLLGLIYLVTARGTDSEVVHTSRILSTRLFCFRRRKSDNVAMLFTPILFRSAFNRV
jgi:hypothetical protein